MREVLDALIEQMATWPPLWSYLLLGLSAFLENVIPPVPGDTVVVFGAYLVGRGVLSWFWVYAATCGGGVLGFMLMWYMGFTRGRSFLESHHHRARLISTAHVARAEQWLDRYGLWLILANRFLSGIRSAIALAAGIGGMGWRGVALLGFVSMAVWNGLLLSLGLLLGRNWGRVLEWLGLYNRLALLALTLLVLGLVGRWWWRRHQRTPDEPSVDSLSESP